MEAMVAIFLTVGTALFVIMGLHSTSTSPTTTSSSTGLSDSVKEKLVKECRVFKSLGDVYTLEDKEVFKDFVQKNIVGQKYKNYTFFKVDGKRYAVRYKITSPAISCTTYPYDYEQMNGVIYLLANNTLDGWTPSPKCPDARITPYDWRDWRGEYACEGVLKRGLNGSIIRGDWNSATIEGGYSVVEKWDYTLGREYKEKYELPDKIKDIMEAEIVEL